MRRLSRYQKEKTKIMAPTISKTKQIRQQEAIAIEGLE
jgi:hypothetical protein